MKLDVIISMCNLRWHWETLPYADNLAMVEFVKNMHSMGLEMY